MARYAVVEDETGLVVNVVEWDGDEETWAPPEGHTMVPDPGTQAGPGFTWDGESFAPPPVPPDPAAVDNQITAVPDTLFGGKTIREALGGQ